MKVGVSTAINSNSMNVAEIAQKAEEVGFDSFWLPEHPIIPVHTTSRYGGTPDGSIPPFMADMGDPFIGLAMASATTTRIMLGTAMNVAEIAQKAEEVFDSFWLPEHQPGAYHVALRRAMVRTALHGRHGRPFHRAGHSRAMLGTAVCLVPETALWCRPSR